ncbi:MAG: hypothetical protein GKR90_05880 [Pseudomonadales bacterium]|nr:hypothetical protein [Pseudomonadales bacterium]
MKSNMDRVQEPHGEGRLPRESAGLIAEEQGESAAASGETVAATQIFHAKSMGAAFKEIRDVLGPDALILNQTVVPGGVEIEAALELPVVQEVHLDPEESNKIVDSAFSLQPEEAFPELTFAGEGISNLAGALRFLGGSGVGKTSMLIKLVVEAAMIKGASKIVVISTDDQRLAGTEQLQLACQMLGVQVLMQSEAQLHQTVQRNDQNSLVLIDTAAIELQRRAPEPIAGVRDIFVCSAEHSVASLIAQRQACGQPRVVAITHLDRPGDRLAVARWLHDSEQSVLFFGSSGYIPEGLEFASATSYASLFHIVDDHASSAISVSV